MKSISVLLISDSYPPKMGGSEVEAQRVAAGLIARGHRIQVITSGGPPMPEQSEWIDEVGVPVRILTRKSKGRVKDYIFAIRVALQLWQHRDVDIVYFLMQGLHLAAGLPVVRMLGKPFIMKFGGSGVIPLMRSSRAGRFELSCLNRWAKQLLVLNEGMIDEALAYGFQRCQLHLMPNPTHTDYFAPAPPAERAALRERFEFSPDEVVILYTGRMSSEKGIPWLLKAFCRVVGTRPQAVLVLLGSGPMEGEIRNLAKSLNLNSRQLRLPGAVPVNEVAHWAQAADIFALTSPSEGFSCALAEAMACGLPAAVSAIPANAQLIREGQEGLNFPSGDIDAIASALETLIDSSELRIRLGKAARRRIVENFSFDQIMIRYETLFSEILSHN